VTHGCDRTLWALRLPHLEPDQANIARAWLQKVSEETAQLDSNSSTNFKRVLTLKVDRNIVWADDAHWDYWIAIHGALASS